MVPVNYKPENNTNWWEMSSTTMHIGLSILILTFLVRMRNGFSISMLMGKSPVKKIHSDKDIKVRFNDVAGMEQAKL